MPLTKSTCTMYVPTIDTKSGVNALRVKEFGSGRGALHTVTPECNQPPYNIFDTVNSFNSPARPPRRPCIHYLVRKNYFPGATNWKRHRNCSTFHFLCTVFMPATS